MSMGDVDVRLTLANGIVLTCRDYNKSRPYVTEIYVLGLGSARYPLPIRLALCLNVFSKA